MFYSGSVVIHSVTHFYEFGVIRVWSSGLGDEVTVADHFLSGRPSGLQVFLTWYI